jgi:hypothetical protein
MKDNPFSGRGGQEAREARITHNEMRHLTSDNEALDQEVCPECGDGDHMLTHIEPAIRDGEVCVLVHARCMCRWEDTAIIKP